jgi:hypothetical protein
MLYSSRGGMKGVALYGYARYEVQIKGLSRREDRLHASTVKRAAIGRCTPLARSRSPRI